MWANIRFNEAKALAAHFLHEDGCPAWMLDDASDDWAYDHISDRLHVRLTGVPKTTNADIIADIEHFKAGCR